MPVQLNRAAWLAGYLTVLVGPAALWVASTPTQPLWDMLATLTGLLATSALVCTIAAPSRLHSLNRAFGIESVMGVHRFLGVATGSLVLTHLATVVAADPTAVALLDIADHPPQARAALAATTALIALIIVAARRDRLGLPYERWRWLHLALTATVLVGAALHVIFIGQLIRHPVHGLVLQLLAGLLVVVLSYRWVWRVVFDPSQHFIVRDVRPETPTVTTLSLTPTDRSWKFAPGQFVWLRLQRAITAQEHPFTVASSAEHTNTTEITIRTIGDFGRALARLRPGSSVWVDGPHGGFTNEHSTAETFVLVASGVGVTPMLSMLRTAADRQDPRPYRLMLAGEQLFTHELAELSGRLDLQVTPLTRRERIEPLPTTTGPVDYYLCGAPDMVHTQVTALTDSGVPLDRIYTEQFDLA